MLRMMGHGLPVRSDTVDSIECDPCLVENRNDRIGEAICEDAVEPNQFPEHPIRFEFTRRKPMYFPLKGFGMGHLAKGDQLEGPRLFTLWPIDQSDIDRVR